MRTKEQRSMFGARMKIMWEQAPADISNQIENGNLPSKI